jgi:hypothetical protein
MIGSPNQLEINLAIRKRFSEKKRLRQRIQRGTWQSGIAFVHWTLCSCPYAAAFWAGYSKWECGAFAEASTRPVGCT